MFFYRIYIFFPIYFLYGISAGLLPTINFLQDASKHWINFKTSHSKQFSPEEEILRFNIFKKNLQRIDALREQFQKGLIHFQVGITEFSDLSKEEFITKHLTLKFPNGQFKRHINENHQHHHRHQNNRTIRQVPQIFDWRNHGAVTQVKHQGSCASCWAFSAVGALESQHYLKHGTLVELSEQNLMDCSVDQINRGCNGGWMANAFQYLTQHSISSTQFYPYVGFQQGCASPQSGSFQISIQGYQTIQPDEYSLLEAVATIGPISVAIDATNLQFYAGGVFRDDECVNGHVNHGVLVIGYGLEAGRDYWLIKNSWGASWGENGYFKMIRNKGNQCSIASYGMYPIYQ